MLRMAVILAALACFLDCQDVHGQQRGFYRTNSFGYGAGFGPGYNPGYAYPYPVYDYGYVYDPYARGRFEWPDPLNDPYLQTKYKYDTFFPGRKSRRARLRFRRN